MRLCPWSLALASSTPVLGLERFCPRKGCPWPWPRIFFVSLALASSRVSSTPPLSKRMWKIVNELIYNKKRSRTVPSKLINNDGIVIVGKSMADLTAPGSSNKFYSNSCVCCCCCCSVYLSSCYWTASDANLLDDTHTFHYQDYFVIGGIRTCLRVSDDLKRNALRNVPVDFFEFLSTEFAACSKPPSRDNHRKASYPRAQQHD